MELAHLRRNLYGKKSELLAQTHPDLFDETLSDLAAVNTEIEQLAPSSKTKQPRAPALVQDDSHYRNICRASITCMNRNPASAVSVGRNW